MSSSAIILLPFQDLESLKNDLNKRDNEIKVSLDSTYHPQLAIVCSETGHMFVFTAEDEDNEYKELLGLKILPPGSSLFFFDITGLLCFKKLLNIFKSESYSIYYSDAEVDIVAHSCQELTTKLNSFD